MSDIGALSSAVSAEEFLDRYEPWMAASWRDSFGDPLLARALANHDPVTRVDLASRLLDDGADASAQYENGGTAAHMLLAQVHHNPEVEAPLLERLFDGGADVNKVVRTKALGTPLNALVGKFKFSDEFFAPFYDVFFSRGDLDLQGEMMNGHSGMNILRKSAELRPELLRRAEEYLRARGVDPDEVK